MSLGRIRERLGIPRTVLLLASTHFLVDGFGNVYAPLLPLLIPRLGLSLTAAGTLAMLFQIATSISQLGFGSLADRWRPRLLLVSGPFLSVIVLSWIGLANSTGALAAVLIVGGLGGAAFHPPAAALVHRVAGRRQGLAMSMHITGGTLGFSLGPLIFAPFVERFGLRSSWILAIPAVAILAAMIRHVPPVDTHIGTRGRGFRALRPYALPLTLLYLIVVLRTVASTSFSTFVPVMLTRRGLSVGEAGVTTAFYLLATGIGGFLGGPFADRFGARRMIALSLVIAVPFLVAAPSLSGWPFAVTLACGGFFLQSTLPVNVTFGQSIAPVSAATVSSLMMGFAWGTGGLCVPLVGYIADHLGIPRTLTIMALMPLAAAACAIPLPATRAHVPPRGADVGFPETV
jgi:MFS transporter, FSR family, fosmidomycin resistance protein